MHIHIPSLVVLHYDHRLHSCINPQSPELLSVSIIDGTLKVNTRMEQWLRIRFECYQAE